MALKEKRKKSTDETRKKKAKVDVDSPLQKLEKLVTANYFVTLQNCLRQTEVEILQILSSSVKIEGISFQHRDKDDVLIAFNVVQDDSDNKSENFGVIIGPSTEDGIEKIGEFYKLWGKENCKLRRFQDGSTHESVSLNNPSGVTYMPLTKLKHIMQVHYPDVQVKFHHFNEDFRFESHRSYGRLLERRKFVDEFCSKIREVLGHGTEMPLRKIEPISTSLYKGDTNNHHTLSKIHSESNTKVVINGEIREKATNAPCLLNALSIELEITQKSQMSTNMFARLKMAYAIKLKDLLNEKLGLKTALRRDGEVMVVYEDFVFALKIKAPDQLLQAGKFSLQEYLGMVGIHNQCFSGVCTVVKKWMASQFLAKSIDESTIDIIVATLFSDEAKKPVSVENGLLQFLKVLSLTDFSQKNLVLGSDLDESKFAKFQYDFKQKREKYPDLTIISNLDWESTWTRNLSKPHFIRLVNCARMTLHQLTSNLDFDGVFNDVFKVNEDLFDVVLVLKPFQIPSESQSGKFQGELKTFPVVNYRPLDQFWNELSENFGQQAQFYCNDDLHKIGIKFTESDVKLSKVIMEDIQVLGKDFVKYIVVNRK